MGSVYFHQLCNTDSAVYCASEKAGLSGFALYNVEIQIFLLLDRLHHVSESISMLAHGIIPQSEVHNCLMLVILS